MEETLVFIDEGFLDKLTKKLGGGKRIKFDKFSFAGRIAKKQNLICKHLFYYTAPPFQSENPSDKTRNSKFSLSNELISCCSKHIKLSKEEFNKSPLIN